MQEYNIGAKIRKLRLSRKMTLQTVARGTGFSPALISQIENGNVSPPITTLSKLSKFFEVKIGMFFVDDEVSPYEVVRKGEQKPVRRFVSRSGACCDYCYESLSFRKANKRMEPFLLTVAGSVSAEEGLSHDGEEFIFIMEGSAELLLDGERLILEEGDSVYFNSTLKHAISPKGGAAVKALAVVTR